MENFEARLTTIQETQKYLGDTINVRLSYYCTCSHRDNTLQVLNTTVPAQVLSVYKHNTPFIMFNLNSRELDEYIIVAKFNCPMCNTVHYVFCSICLGLVDIYRYDLAYSEFTISSEILPIISDTIRKFYPDNKYPLNSISENIDILSTLYVVYSLYSVLPTLSPTVLKQFRSYTNISLTNNSIYYNRKICSALPIINQLTISTLRQLYTRLTSLQSIILPLLNLPIPA